MFFTTNMSFFDKIDFENMFPIGFKSTMNELVIHIFLLWKNNIENKIGNEMIIYIHILIKQQKSVGKVNLRIDVIP